MNHLHRIRYGLCDLGAVPVSMLKQWADDALAAGMTDVRDKIGCEIVYRS